MKISKAEDLPKDISSLDDEAQIIWLCDLSDWIMEDGVGHKERAELSIPFLNMINNYPLFVFFRLIHHKMIVCIVKHKTFADTLTRVMGIIEDPKIHEKVKERVKEYKVAVE